MMRNKKLPSHTLSLLLAFALWQPLAAAGDIYDGTWLNIDPDSRGITRAVVSSGMFSATVHIWASCSPDDCDWGQQIVIASSSPFGVDYDQGSVVRRLTFDFISPQSLHIHQRNVYTNGNPDTNYDYYFYRQGYPPDPLPDLIISQISIPQRVVEYAATPWTWASFTTKNIGPGILTGGELRAVIAERTRDGQTMASTGYFQINYTPPFEPGDTATNQFAVGTNSYWPVGSYAIRIKIDSENAVQEYSEKNNLSPVLRFDVLQQRYLAGELLYNGAPLAGRTAGFVTNVVVRDYSTGETITGYDFWYDSETGHYYFSNLPDTSVRILIWLYPPDRGVARAGAFLYGDTVDLPSLSSAAADFDLDVLEIIHLLQPRDNADWDEDLSGHDHCGRIDFRWESLPGAAYYDVIVDRFRYGTHPSGYGYIGTMYHASQNDTEFSIKLPTSEPDEHYQFRLDAYNAGDEKIGQYMAARQSAYGWDYRIRVIGQARSVADINGDCAVNMADLAILAQHWLENTRTP